MTSENKAIELIECFYSQIENYYVAKECALMSVYEVIKAFESCTYYELDKLSYWLEVERQINKYPLD